MASQRAACESYGPPCIFCGGPSATDTPDSFVCGVRTTNAYRDAPVCEACAMADDESSGEHVLPSGLPRRLGRYHVAHELGHGGMASVHLARVDGEAGQERWRVIKLVHANLQGTELASRFVQVARALRRLSHRHVAATFEVEEVRGAPWLAMEYVHGEPLSEVTRRASLRGLPFPRHVACRIVADVARGVDRLHAALSAKDHSARRLEIAPRNAWVRYDGIGKVVPKLSPRRDDPGWLHPHSVASMSPEQLYRAGVDERTDIFVLGVLLWELTTGQRLFQATTDLETVRRVMECKVPRPSTFLRGYPPELEAVALCATARNRRDRFPTAGRMADALAPLSASPAEVALFLRGLFADRIAARDEELREAALLFDA